ncbi:microtubule-binding protein [Saccharomycopsis crataegensis]|uniref:Microtubule-binding protein n=1 Tax=Saccharomycopsis crataegensis TaxID=43959 RepID=A0AAV5QP12_9ASCO|nr:microtubule-binding protein [Saccharomycopsis crataegensis]
MSINLGESRSELLHWLNNFLDLNYTKVEQCGTGAAYCQILDSIYGDVPMNKVKFTVQFEYEYLQNYKVLQSAFAKHGIAKVVLVEKLSKCKLQDNLEFLQWLKRFWAENKDETHYDPNSRRKALPKSTSNSRTGSSLKQSRPATRTTSSVTNNKPTMAKRNLSGIRNTNANHAASASATTTNASPVKPSSTTRTRMFGAPATSKHSTTATNGGPIRPKAGVSAQQMKLQKELEKEIEELRQELAGVTEELDEYKVAAEGLETERNFYFNKLRDIEILSQATTDDLSEQAEQQHQQQLNGDLTNDVLKNNQSLIEFVEKVQDILYSTEEGFQVPDQVDEEGEEFIEQENDILGEEEPLGDDESF